MQRLGIAVVCSLFVISLATPANAQGSTRRAAPMIGRPKTEVAGAYWARHGVIAIAGGFVDGGSPTAELLFYDVETEAWTRGPDLPGRRDHAALVVVRDLLYLVGGFTTGLSGATAEAWQLKTPSGRWAEVAPMHTARGALGATAVDGSLIAVGGVDATGRDLRTTEWYDPRADRWRPGPDLSRTRQHVGVSTQGRAVYAIGGRSPNLDTVERLTFRNGAPAGTWRAAPSLQYSRSGNGAATAGGIVCTAGGEEPTGTIAPIECLGDAGWTRVADLAVPRHGLAVVAVGKQLHAISGGPMPGFSFSIEHEVLDVSQ